MVSIFKFLVFIIIVFFFYFSSDIPIALLWTSINFIIFSSSPFSSAEASASNNENRYKNARKAYYSHWVFYCLNLFRTPVIEANPIKAFCRFITVVEIFFQTTYTKISSIGAIPKWAASWFLTVVIISAIFYAVNYIWAYLICATSW